MGELWHNRGAVVVFSQQAVVGGEHDCLRHISNRKWQQKRVFAHHLVSCLPKALPLGKKTKLFALAHVLLVMCQE